MPDGHWHVDSGDTAVGQEPPGPPVPGGPWEVTCRLVRGYEFAEPRILPAVYRGRPDCSAGTCCSRAGSPGCGFTLGSG